MKFTSRPFAMVVGIVWLAGSTFAANEGSEADVEGRALAAELRAQQPVENSEWSGTLKIRGRDRRITTIPITGRVVVEPGGWKVTYATSATNQIGAETLTVLRSASTPVLYQFSKPVAGSTPGDPKQLTGPEADLPLAGSDFWLSDLGLEFFHWPGQRLLKKELRRGQSCNVLESFNPQPATNGYSRVVSWIDIDTGGIVHADAYDSVGKRLKEFEPKEFRKVHGQWELREMEIRNLKTGSRTLLEFDLAK